MKNIAIVTPTLNRGGAERVAANMSLEFAKRWNVVLVVFDGRDAVYPHAERVIDLRLPPARTKIGKAVTLFRRVAALRQIKRRHRIDVTISHLPSANYANIFARAGDRIFTYVHLMEPHKPTMIARGFITGLLSHRVVCVSECVRRNVIDHFGVSARKAVTMYNFCDLEQPAISRRDGKTVVTMGRLTEQKGQWHLIRAMRRVVDLLGSAARLVIIGEGDLQPALEMLARRLGIQENVHFAGFLEDPWTELARGDVYVSPSLWEGLPMALVEATRCGLPVIATDCDAGCREILAPGADIARKTEAIELAKYGVLTPVCGEGDLSQLTLTREEELMAEAILRMLRDDGLRLKYASRAKQRAEDFRPERIMTQWERLIEDRQT